MSEHDITRRQPDPPDPAVDSRRYPGIGWDDHFRPGTLWDVQSPAAGRGEPGQRRTLGKGRKQDRERNVLIHHLGGPAITAPSDAVPPRAAQDIS